MPAPLPLPARREPRRAGKHEHAGTLDRFPAGQRIDSEQAQRDFIQLFGAVLRLRNILTSFDDFAGEGILSERQMQDYRSEYLNLHAEYRAGRDAEKERINDDLVFEIELIKQVEINVDYILLLVDRYRKERGDGKDTEVRAEITRAIDSSPSLRNKKDLIEAFVERVSATGDIDEEWASYVAARRAAELDSIISAENLRSEATLEFIHRALRDGIVQSTGIAITQVLPPTSRFHGGDAHGEKKQRVLARLTEFVERYFGLGAGSS